MFISLPRCWARDTDVKMLRNSIQTARTTAWAGVFESKVSLLVCSIKMQYLGAGLIQKEFWGNILNFKAKQDTNKDHSENFSHPNPYVYRSVFRCKHSEDTNTAPPHNRAKCNPSPDRHPRKGARHHRNSLWPNPDSRPLGEGPSTHLQGVCVTHGWLNFILSLLSGCSNLLSFKHTSINCESDSKGSEVACLQVRYQQGWESPGFQDSSGFLYFVIKQGFGQICPYFFKIKRMWAVKFINGKTATLSLPRRNFWPSRKAFFLRKERLSWNRIRMSETLKWFLTSDFNASLSNTK